MLENVGRKVITILVLLLVSVLLLTLKSPPFQLGLDLKGGTRLTYSVDFDAAYADGRLDRSENQVDVLNQIIQIIRTRVDPTGLLDPLIRASGRDRIIIELPGTLGLPSKEAVSPLAELITPTSIEIPVADATDFPDTGAVKIGLESIRYDDKIGNRLQVVDGSRKGGQEHAAGEPVVLEKDDAFRNAIESLGELTFQIVARTDNLPLGVDLTAETEKKDKWGEANPRTPIAAFNHLTEAEGGPHPSIEWVPERAYDDAGKAADEYLRARPLLVPKTEAEKFTGAALSRVYPTQGDFGPAVGFEIQPSRRSDFGEFTGSNVDQQMAIVLNGEIHSAPTLEERLSQGGRITGHFSDADVRDLMTVLRSGSLKIKPKLEDDERVSATLGDDYVLRGEWSGAIALLAVLVFMAVYYRRLGLFAGASLLLSFVMLLGALSFGNATITLPGIAGIILTVGMAVDANILIFDRIREEMDKGRNVKQAAKEGFDRAMPAILDSNITTFLTALILREVGTGPIRGFAVTLMWGIVCSVFAALVITRVLVHFSLQKGAKRFSMGQWLVTANFEFASKAKLALTASAIAILAGLTAFVATPDSEKLGIDFLGGAEAQLRTAQPQDLETVRAAVAGLEGIGASADVKAVLESEVDGRYERFRVTFKTGDREQELGSDSNIRARLLSGLVDLLLQDPIQVSVEPIGGGKAKASIALHFDELHPPADIQKILEDRGLSGVEVSATEVPNEYLATAEVAAGRTADSIDVEIQAALKEASDSTEREYKLAEGLASYASVGAQVVGELRDKALLALAISLFVIVLYIRVRFAEYSYGYAAVAALLHDVLITLGVLTLANHFGIVNGEINLPMIAAFLTIIGYSLNDTIIIFDRVRENLPRMKKPFHEVVDLSINQTLSRTVMTSGTTFLAVAIMYVVNRGTGNVLESFAFAMIVGIFTGTYSTIFVANPVLVWLEKRGGRIGPDGMLVAGPVPRPKDPRGKSRGEVETAHV